MYMSSCEKKLNGYVNLKRTVGYQSTIIGEFACYRLACLSSCLITEWLQLPHEATSSCHRVSVYCTVSCFTGSVFTSMGSPDCTFHWHLFRLQTSSKIDLLHQTCDKEFATYALILTRVGFVLY